VKFTAQSALQKLTQARAFSSDLDDADKLAQLNQALESVILDERFVGSEAVIAVMVDGSGILTLPRQFVTIKAAKVGGNVRDLAGPWWSFLPGTTDVSQFSLTVNDQEDRWPLITDPLVTPVFLKAVVSESGVEDSLIIYGRDINGNEVWNGTQRGIVVNFNDSYVDSGGIVLIDSVIKNITDQPVFLYAQNGVVDQLLGIYQPGETLPSYRRYSVPEATNAALAIESPPGDPMIVQCLVQLRHIDLVADNDILPLSNFNGLKHAVLAQHWFLEGDETRAQSNFDTAISFFNSELKRQRPPSELGAVHINAIGGAGASSIRSFR
jgi:hypothetical protein